MSLAVAQFIVQTPCEDEVPANIAHAQSLGLPEADAELIKSLTVIANGPSARDAPLDGDTLVLNGAGKLFFNTGRAPTYWAVCDPQRDLILDCFDVPLSKDTTYFIASKCHPDVFRRLEGYDVRLWHISDYATDKPARRVPTASSVTLVALGLMRRLGYRHFDIWGWDGCYGEGRVSHATDHAPMPTELDCEVFIGAEEKVSPKVLSFQEEKRLRLIRKLAEPLGLTCPDPPGSVEAVGGRRFLTTRTWALEAHDAAQVLAMADYDVTIHGDGLIKAVIESLKLGKRT